MLNPLDCFPIEYARLHQFGTKLDLADPSRMSPKANIY
jgi:hypothetical protein